MIDLHTHTIFSDGVLVPSELARRAEYKGLKAIGLTDHGDISNLDFIVPLLVRAAESLNRFLRIKIIPGIELTHVPPAQIAELVEQARSLGAEIVIVHGQTLVEPVADGTNSAAIEAGVDVLAHPGLITEADAVKAERNNVLLEISARSGHSLSNGHVAALARQVGAGLVINTDTHSPSDLIDGDAARRIVLGAGLAEADFRVMQDNAARFI
ncbi:MAG: histidinol phosphate phosphatase domain-containing protein [Desulfosudaceae bacterium]